MNMKKPISAFTAEEIGEAAEIIRRLPAEKRAQVVRKLMAMRGPKTAKLAHVNPDSLFGFRGYAVNAGLCTGR